MEPVRVVSDDLVLVDWGPMTLTVSAWLKDKPRPVMAAEAGRAALSFLADLADFRNYLARAQADLPRGGSLPRVVETAVNAVRRVDPSLTPLAAVAGAVAEEVCGKAQGLGADRVIVNNGGDIGIYLGPGQEALVGLKPPQQDLLFSKLHLDSGSGVGGVASSGWQGRSHSPGVADLVSIWAETAALADAAATCIAGASGVDSPAVDTARAREIDPGSDLGERRVTVKVGRLTLEEREEALARGMAAAQRLFEAGAIRGCLIDVQGAQGWLDPDSRLERAG